uniref:GM02481p n=1 Tax=Drosophila melanogaster TaxID=7227 RepID=Q8MRK1_DROME|nr:GM02481p [Drosophila melanogaster]
MARSRCQINTLYIRKRKLSDPPPPHPTTKIEQYLYVYIYVQHYRQRLQGPTNTLCI